MRSGSRARRLLACLAIPFLGSIPHAAASEIDVSKLACDIAPAIAKSGKRAAVVDFVNLKGDPTEFGRYLAEELSVALPACGPSLNLADRTYVKAILAENKLSEKGLISPATARHAAQLIGADLLLIGTITPFGGTVRVTAKLLGAGDGSLVASAGMDLPRTAAVDKLLESDALQSDASGGDRAASLAGTQPGRGGRAGVQIATTRVTVKDFEFNLGSCSFQSGNVVCTFQIRNVGPDAGLFLCAACNGYSQNNYPHIIDDRGNEYIAKRIQLGNDVATAPGGVQRQLATNVPMAALMQFDDVSPDAGSLTLLEFFFDNSGGWHPMKFKAQLRNIPIKRQR
jgi:TolB-like protein